MTVGKTSVTTEKDNTTASMSQRNVGINGNAELSQNKKAAFVDDSINICKRILMCLACQDQTHVLKVTEKTTWLSSGTHGLVQLPGCTEIWEHKIDMPWERGEIFEDSRVQHCVDKQFRGERLDCIVWTSNLEERDWTALCGQAI